MHLRHLAVIAAVPLLLSACGGDDEGGASGEPCDGKLAAAKAKAQLPAALPTGVSGATFFDVQTDGATKRYFAHAAGTDVVKTRDTIKDAFSAAGYEIEGSDEEEQAEAEFEWSKGDEEGSVQVIPLCEGNQRIRWRVGPR